MTVRGGWRAILLLSLVSLVACKPEPEPARRDFRTLQMRIDGCAGNCPEYSVTLDEHGMVHFQGQRWTAVPNAQRQLTEPEFEALKLKLDALIDTPWPPRFDARNCPSFNNGQSSVVWHLETRGKRLELSQSLGCLTLPNADGSQDYHPPEWRALYSELARVSGLSQWVSGK